MVGVDRNQAEIVTEIDPGRAFGTGAHPTTKLLHHELAARIRGGERVLDVGCGSGVLAIAAAQLGAGQVTAIDISPAAIAATQANARRNGVHKKVLAEDTPVAEIAETYDVILANLNAETLRHLARAIQPRLAEGAWLGLSGLSQAQVSKVTSTYSEIPIMATSSEEDWSAIVMGAA